MTAADLINNIEYELRKKRAASAPWPPLSGHDLDVKESLERWKAHD